MVKLTLHDSAPSPLVEKHVRSDHQSLLVPAGAISRAEFIGQMSGIVCGEEGVILLAMALTG